MGAQARPHTSSLMTSALQRHEYIEGYRSGTGRTYRSKNCDGVSVASASVERIGPPSLSNTGVTLTAPSAPSHGRKGTHRNHRRMRHNRGNTFCLQHKDWIPRADVHVGAKVQVRRGRY